MAESRPDPFIRYDYPKLLDESREAIAKLLRAPADTVVFVSNATVAVNTVLKNLIWADDCADEVLYFSTIYSGCGKTIDYIVDSSPGRVSSRMIQLLYPLEDDEIIAEFRAAVEASKDAGKRPRICLFDTVSSMPGVRFPFEAMTSACRDLGILSLVDGAQGVGLLDLDLGKLDPDFFVSNCHKWLHAPRGSAVFYVPLRNQDIIRSTLATSHGYVSQTQPSRVNPLPPNTKSRFVNEFEFLGTLDNSPYLCVKDSLAWREEFLGGESQILEYQRGLAREGGKRAAEILGTEVMENKGGTLTDCGMVNVGLPLVVATGTRTGRDGNGDVRVPREAAFELTQWFLETMMNEYQTFMALCVHRGRWWVRLSAQVYLDTDDFVWAAKVLKELCDRAAGLQLVTGAEGC